LEKEKYMHKFAKKSFVFFLATVMVWMTLAPNVCAQAALQEEEISTENMVADAIIVRPLGLVATVLGVGLFIVSLPFSLLGRNVEEAGQKLVVAPAKFTFLRPLGEF
jgi:hypothetical protein